MRWKLSSGEVAQYTSEHPTPEDLAAVGFYYCPDSAHKDRC